MTEIYERVVAELTANFDLEESEITPDTSLRELELDSLALLELCVIFEERHGLKLVEEAAAALPERPTVADLAAFLETSLAAVGSPEAAGAAATSAATPA